MKTAEKILLTSLDMFNDRGEANVTSVDIALELDISPGNLYYHFKGKEIIVKALFDMYKQRSGKVLLSPKQDSDDITDFFAYLLVLFESALLFRFLYRSPTDLVQKYPSIKREFSQLIRGRGSMFTAILRDYQSRNVIAADDAEINSLAQMLNLALTQSQSYFELMGVDSGDDEAHFDCLKWVYHLLAPYLTIELTTKQRILTSIKEHDMQ